MASDSKYASSKIYKVADRAYTTCYYGSTIQPLSKRLAHHRALCKLFCEGRCHRISVFDIFEAHGSDNCKIELVEECPCENKEQLHKREGFYTQNNECVNKHDAGRKMAEWYADTREQRYQVAEHWRSANEEKVKEMGKNYRAKYQEQIKEKRSAKCSCNVCGSEHMHHVTARHRQTKNI